MVVSGRFTNEPRDAADFLRLCQEGGLDPVALIVGLDGLDHILDELIAMPGWLAPRGCKLLHGLLRCNRINRAQKLVDTGVDFREMDLPHGGTIVHSVLRYANDSRTRCDAVKWALDTYPEAIRVGEPRFGDTPLVMAIALNPTDIDTIRLLIHRGADVNAKVVRTSPLITVTSLVSYAWDRPQSAIEGVRLRSLLIAYGGRIKGGETPPLCYEEMVTANEKCRFIALLMLGLRRMGGCVTGNGRDALQLIAKEVWLSRMDEGWS